MTNSNIDSEIADYYKNKSIFITGATGFIGKVLIEKLLRSCNELNNIYILTRTKKGQHANSRLNDLLNFKIFDDLKKSVPNIREKLIVVQGDLLEPNLGLSQEDEKKLIDNVNIVFHSAATVRFDEPLKLAVNMNMKGTKKMITLAKKLKKLEVFVHVSTAYAYCERQHISEIVYDMPMPPEKIMEMCEWMEEDLINFLTPKIIKSRPNTYTYTKAMAECLIKEVEKELPIVIVRPSIVGAAWREPLTGWIDNYNGPSAMLVALGKGVYSAALADKKATADLIPVDITVNLMIASSWFSGKNKTTESIVYNCTSGSTNPIEWGLWEKFTTFFMQKNPFEQIIFTPVGIFTNSNAIKYFYIFFEQTIPAYLLDLYLILTKQKPRFVRIQTKILNGIRSLEYFTTHEWELTNKNVAFLESKLNETDKKV